MEINYNRLAKAITRAGVILVKNGAEISRVEDTMERLCFAYGAKAVDSYATPTILIISFSMEDDSELYHNIKRVSAGSVNLNKIDMVNSLSREIQKNVLSIEEFNSKLDVIEKDNENVKSFCNIIICKNKDRKELYTRSSENIFCYWKTRFLVKGIPLNLNDIIKLYNFKLDNNNIIEGNFE